MSVSPAYGILFPQPRIEPSPLVLNVWSPDPWTARAPGIESHWKHSFSSHRCSSSRSLRTGVYGLDRCLYSSEFYWQEILSFRIHFIGSSRKGCLLFDGETLLHLLSHSLSQHYTTPRHDSHKEWL